MLKRAVLLVVVVCFCTMAASAGDFASQREQNWHQWRGPNADGVSPSADPPVQWSEQSNVKWKVAIPGKGSATPIVWNDRIYLLSAIETDKKPAQPPARSAPAPSTGRALALPAPSTLHQYVVLCLDRATGKTLWQRVAAEEVPHEGRHDTNTFASGSPTTDGQLLYASFGSRGIFCFDLDGSPVWKRDLGDMRTRAGFGEGSSPALHGNTLVVNWDHEGQSFIAALDAKTGETRWQVNRDERTTWATPLITEYQGRTQVITNASKRVRSYDLATGEVIWECGGQAGNPIPCPIRQDDIVYCMTGYQGYAVYALPLAAKGDITGTPQIVWRRTDTGPYVCCGLLYDGLLYVTKGRDAIASVLDPKTGSTITDQKRLPGLSTLYASPVAAAGRIYYVARDGTALVLKHGPELEVLATNKLDEGIDASPVPLGKQLFLLGEKSLYCIEAR
jgi:outer membrane protein assembly factor BamB